MSIIQLETTSDANTVTVNDMILRLDALAKGYEEVLEIAKKQLETYEISESDWSRLAKKVSSLVSYQCLSYELMNSLSDGLREIEQSEAGSAVATSSTNITVATSVINRLEIVLRKRIIEHALRAEIKVQVAEALKDYKLNIAEHAEAAAEDKFRVLQRDIVKESIQVEGEAKAQTLLIKDLLIRTLGPDLRRMSGEAIQDCLRQDIEHAAEMAVRSVLAERKLIQQQPQQQD